MANKLTLDEVGVEPDNAAQVIYDLRRDLKALQQQYARLYDSTRCEKLGCDGEKNHDGRCYQWVAE